ncbi:MAG TPA: biopolymer transporter ExbD [Cyclobacteriaceae bacterium]|nr:biopolymer transporter ExbD [Cyclobacteriaceae bacterium]
MAEITQRSAQGSRARIRSKKRSTHIDMTPMVDLAFLLLTFFILTTTFSKLNFLDIIMPEKTGEQTPVSAKRVLTLILDEGDKLYWQTGSESKPQSLRFAHDPVNRLLTSKNTTIEKMLVVVKPTDRIRYKNLVDIMDAISIAKIERYCIVDATPEDEALIKASKRN